MPSILVDSSAALALLFDEKSRAGSVEAYLAQAIDDKEIIVITSINWAEVLTHSLRQHGENAIREARKFLRETGMKVVAVDEEIAELTASLKNRYKLSLAEACCADFSVKHGFTLLTTDTDFEGVRSEANVKSLR